MHRFSRILAVTLTVFAIGVSCPCLHGQADTGLLCVAPNSAEMPQRCAPGLCAGGELSLKVDGRPVQPWPKSESMKIAGLSTSEQHRVVIYRAGKAQQSFKFRFPQNKPANLCLFLNDLYWTAQLWEPKSTPWCKCK